MRIYKFFELHNALYSVKEDLTKDDIDDIMDAFTLYILDKYRIELVAYRKDLLIPYSHHGPEAVYCVDYSNRLNKVFNICIRKLNTWNQKEFNSDMTYLKARLTKLGFIAIGRALSSTTIGDKRSWYELDVFKPMFAKKSNKNCYLQK